MIPYEEKVKEYIEFTKRELKKLRKDRHDIRHRKKLTQLEKDAMHDLQEQFYKLGRLKSSCEDALKIEYSLKKPERIESKWRRINDAVKPLREFGLTLQKVNLEEDYPELFLGV